MKVSPEPLQETNRILLAAAWCIPEEAYLLLCIFSRGIKPHVGFGCIFPLRLLHHLHRGLICVQNIFLQQIPMHLAVNMPEVQPVGILNPVSHGRFANIQVQHAPKLFLPVQRKCKQVFIQDNGGHAGC